MVLIRLKSLGKPILSASSVIWGRSSTSEYCEVQFRISDRILLLQWTAWLSSHKSHFPRLEPLLLELQAGLPVPLMQCFSSVVPRPVSSFTWETESKFSGPTQISWIRNPILPSGDSKVYSYMRTTVWGQILALSARNTQHLEVCTSILVACRQMLSNVQVELQIQPVLSLFPWSHPFRGYPWLLTDFLSCHLPGWLNNTFLLAREHQFIF